MYLQGGRKNEGALQEMARNLTIAVAPDDFKPANQLEPQVKLLPSFYARVHALPSRWWHQPSCIGHKCMLTSRALIRYCLLSGSMNI